MNIKTVVDSERGCGWRKPGGLYLVSDGVPMPCGRLPLPLTRCPCCDAGIKPSRGWTRVNPKLLFSDRRCLQDHAFGSACIGIVNACPWWNPPESAGLLWIGEKFYKTPEAFTNEAAKFGISRRIKSVPRDFKLGETWVLFAHRLGMSCDNCKDGACRDCSECGDTGKIPAIVYAFRPTEIQYVTKGDETEEELTALMERGITPVKVERAGQTNLALPKANGDEDGGVE